MCLLNHLHSLPLRKQVSSHGKTLRHAPLLFLLAAFTAAPALATQAAPPAVSAPGQPAGSRTPHRHHLAKSQQAVEPAPAPQAAPVPEQPKWPANEAPGKPEITWDSHGLRIDAANSSLHQILDQVSTATGAKVEGLGADERVFGNYGPGDARDVLSQLLHGSSYNVLMIGDQGRGTPREIVLSARHGGVAPNRPAAGNPSPDAQPDEETPEQPEQQEEPQPPPQMMQPPVQQGPPGAPGQPRTPQELLQELQQRQQEMQNQQNQQMPQQPIPSPQPE